MKKLITKAQVEEYSASGSAELVVDGDTILTPSAKDLARNKGIKLVYESAAERDACTQPQEAAEAGACEGGPRRTDDTGFDRDTVTKAVIAVLKEKGLLNRVIE